VTTTIVTHEHPDTRPSGIPRAVARDWRPEHAINDSLFALADRLDGRDPLWDDVAGIAATRLLMAGAELDVVYKRRAARTTVVDLSRGPQ
jgi:hypothetical protein